MSPYRATLSVFLGRPKIQNIFEDIANIWPAGGHQHHNSGQPWKHPGQIKDRPAIYRKVTHGIPLWDIPWDTPYVFYGSISKLSDDLQRICVNLGIASSSLFETSATGKMT